MQINITGHHVSVTPGLETMVYDKLSVVKKHFEHIMTCHVVLSLDNKHTDKTHKGHSCHKAEVLIRVRGHEFFAHCYDDNMYDAINAVVAKIDRQIVNHKQKTKPKHANKSALTDALLSVDDAV